MNNMQIFNNADFGQIRTLKEQSNILFCASDIAKALGYAKPNNAIAKYCRATLKRGIPLAGKIQEINFISESDVYRLIVKSKLPAAEKFECWVFDEVLPTIRKTGSYQIKPKPDYQYQPKTWLGVPVVTVSDICYFSGISRHTIREALKKHCIFDEDYTVLEGSNLLHFKAENKTADLRMRKSLLVISQSGFAKLSACLANFPALEKCFSLPPAKKPPKDEHRKLNAEAVNILDNLDNFAKSIQSLIMCMKKSSCSFEEFKGRTETLLFLAFNLEITAGEIQNMNNPF